jgi:hypothetical protein
VSTKAGSAAHGEEGQKQLVQTNKLNKNGTAYEDPRYGATFLSCSKGGRRYSEPENQRDKKEKLEWGEFSLGNRDERNTQRAERGKKVVAG